MNKVSKIIDINELGDYGKKLKRHKRKIVFTNGCFDILHVGHLYLLKRAKSLGDILIVGLNSDRSIRKIKGEGRPVLPEKYRMLALSILPWVDAVIKFNEETPERIIRILKPDVVVKGSDWKGVKLPAEEFVKGYGGRYKRIKIIDGISTTSIIKWIMKSMGNKK